MQANKNTGEVFWSFRIGTNEYVGKDSKGEAQYDSLFFDLTVENAELAKKLRKGTPVVAVGEFYIREFTKNDGTPGYGAKLNYARITLMPQAKANTADARQNNNAEGAAFPDVQDAPEQRDPRYSEPDVAPY
jgi:single-stranded DNA-binding protein